MKVYRKLYLFLGFVGLILAGLAVCRIGWAAESPDSYWDQGLAEVNRFALEQERYGQIRHGEAVLIYVKEPFRTDVQVKYEGGDDKNVEPVLKLNFTRNFLTGIYPYSTMTSIFAPTGGAQPLKLTSSIQEWCGQRFVQINRKGDSFHIQGFSYFDKVRDRMETVGDAVLEDSLWTTIRLSPDRLPTGGFAAVPGTEYCELRFVPHRAYPAVGNLRTTKDAKLSDGPLKVYRLEYTELGRWLEITFEAEPPYALVKWEEVYKVDVNGPEMVTRGVRTHQQTLAYWNMNGIEDESRRADLGLIAYADLMTPEDEETKAMNDKQATTKQDDMVTIYDVETDRTEAMPKVEKSDEAWQEQLSHEEYAILRHAGTERAFTGKLYKNKETGHYVCKACGTDLYLSDDKFDSGSGWPSYTRPVAESNVIYHQDVSHGMIRTEVRCARCGSHLGHVFDDGPAPTGKRHCINSACLDFVPKK